MPSPSNLISSAKPKKDAIALIAVSENELETVLQSLGEASSAWAEANKFDGGKGKVCLLPGEGGKISKALVGTGKNAPASDDCWWIADSIKHLPDGDYFFADKLDAETQASAALGWALTQYQFDRYREASGDQKKLVGLSKAVVTDTKRQIDAICLVRDLVNTPAEDMGPADLQDATEALAEEFGGTCATIVGEDLLDENFPAIHAVGRAAAEGREPRIIDLRWGDADAPALTLVGKGVCFDTGGLDIKPSAGMRMMKKDMGGAAHVLGLARLIMASKLKINLRVLISAVENVVSGNSYRPGDVVHTRKGLTVEIGNTDAEGRVVLCDALALACEEEQPALLMDFATLTGAARIALGGDLPATYSSDDDLWNTLETAAEQTKDPLWRLPLWQPYKRNLASSIADIGNVADSGFAGSITAALYLQQFVAEETPWVHVDVFAWNQKTRPGRPAGGEAQGIRASFMAIKSYLGV